MGRAEKSQLRLSAAERFAVPGLIVHRLSRTPKRSFRGPLRKFIAPITGVGVLWQVGEGSSSPKMDFSHDDNYSTAKNPSLHR